MPRSSLMSSLAAGVESIKLPDLFPAGARKAKQSVPSKPVQAEIKEPMKPWSYRLPSFLRPQPGTTYDLKFSSPSSQATAPKRVGILQAVLYGVPNPGEEREGGEGVLHKVIYGVKDKEEGVVAKVAEGGKDKEKDEDEMVVMAVEFKTKEEVREVEEGGIIVGK